ncbi:DUF3797 domain-containing protein [Bacillus cereus]|uniref:RNA polymerase sigma-70 region 4 domain-containing protein n=1 Tax=Bacillus thuringiensis subsp. finitimus TaxID=29337 RepID=A0A243GW82_BACTF|nr:hypothetical protein BK772_00345 [Bacillus thuringiensis serovar finitimus]PEC83952.1 DUF3797 domain-containing protein [Bacillus cereus]TXR91820.1 DUF3797 domain-containing protein [Bacillus sp. SH7-1]PEQ49778.1 DUF3797 domain-containing protein [Bacillus cereus]PEX30989.1 DUF3797 domain-containing protein [Bacillus cereus]
MTTAHISGDWRTRYQHVTSFYFKTNHKVWCKAILSLLRTHIPMIIFIDMKGVNMDLIIQTFPLDGKTLYYVQCPVCKNNRILNSGANVSRIISDDTFRKLCGCTCDVKQTATKVEAPKKVKKEAVKKEAAPKRTGKVLTAVINGKEMTVKEIAETYDISTSTVRQRINAGKPESEIIAPTKKK